MIGHIGIQIHKNDVSDFYTDVLGGEKKYSFQIDRNLSEKIFSRKQSAEVIFMNLEDLDVELFLCENSGANSSYQHICLQRNNAEEIYNKAKRNNYYTYVHKKTANRQTFFIRDRAGNIFEITNG